MDTPEFHDHDNQPVDDSEEIIAEEMIAEEMIIEETEQSKKHIECDTNPNEPTEELAPSPEQPAKTKTDFKKPSRIALGIICSIIPIIAGVVATIVALDCNLNSKYIGDRASIALTIISIASVVLPFVCALILSRINTAGKTKRVSWSSLLPLVASLYLAYHTLMNDLGKWGNAILLLSLITSAFFVLKMFINKDALKILGAIGIFALSTAIIGLLYLDFQIELNSPFKLSIQFGAVGLMLGTIADARATLFRIKPAWFIFFKSVASSLCLICAGLILTVFSRGFNVFPEIYFVLSILYTCYAINSIAEILSVTIPFSNSDIDTHM